MMRRAWFQAADGSYYRNVPLIMQEQEQRLNTLLPWRVRALEHEWQEAWREGWIQSVTIGRWDRVVKGKPFREAYPDKPGLWVLDDPPPAAPTA